MGNWVEKHKDEIKRMLVRGINRGKYGRDLAAVGIADEVVSDEIIRASIAERDCDEKEAEEVSRTRKLSLAGVPWTISPADGVIRIQVGHSGGEYFYPLKDLATLVHALREVQGEEEAKDRQRYEREKKEYEKLQRASETSTTDRQALDRIAAILRERRC